MNNKVSANKAGTVIGMPPKSFTTRPFDLASFLSKHYGGSGWSISTDPISGKEDVDPREHFLKEIKISSLVLEPVFKKTKDKFAEKEEPYRLEDHASSLGFSKNEFTGEERLSLLKKMPLIRLGGNAFLGLRENFLTNRKNSVLEYLYRTQKIDHLCFMGLIFYNPYALMTKQRSMLVLDRRGSNYWRWNVATLKNCEDCFLTCNSICVKI